MSSEKAPRVAFSNRTNAAGPLPTLHDERTLKRRISMDGGGNKKRVRLQTKCNANERETLVIHDDPMDAQPLGAGTRHCATFSTLRAAHMQPRRPFQSTSLSTMPILKTFVSSNKSDVYNLHSEQNHLGPGIPFACAFSTDGKKGGVPILAVAMQEGTVELLNVSKREDWDFEPQRTRFSAHKDAILAIKWGFSDQTLATASGDSTIKITSVSTQRSLAVLTHHKSSVKTLDWDPNHADLLSTAGRDGSICVWDLRTKGQGDGDTASLGLNPVAVIPHAHCDTVPRGNTAKSRSSSKTVTSLLYLPQNSQQLVSSGSFDGVLKQWDLRYSATGKAKKPTLLLQSWTDPTLETGRRSRGISDLTLGRNYSAGKIWGLAADSCIHTYPMPLSAQSTHSAPHNKLTHPNLYVTSFYVQLATSPCGTWLASGSSGGGVYLWDVASRQLGPRKAVELKASGQEIGPLDWANNCLAGCCDDGTVRIWRPDLEVSSICRADPQEKRWDWAWASEDM